MELDEYLIGFAHARKYDIDLEHLPTVVKGLEKNFTKTGLRTCPCLVLRDATFADVCPCASVDEMIAKNGRCRCGLYSRKK